MTLLELAQDNVRDARLRLDLVRSFSRGSRLTEELETKFNVVELTTSLEQYVRQQEDYWEAMLREEDRLSTLSLTAADRLCSPQFAARRRPPKIG